MVGRKYLQIIYLIKDLYLEYIKNSYNSIIKTNYKVGVRILNRNLTKEDTRLANKVLNIIN